MGFEYFRPGSVEEAVSLLFEHGPQMNVLAGGTDLLVKIKHKAIHVSKVMDITGIDDLRILNEDNQDLIIGAAITQNEIVRHPIVAQKYTALKEGAGQLGSRQVRNLATVVGNICNASPSAETAPALLVYEAKVTAVSCRDSREIAIKDFFAGPGKNSLAPGELVTKLSLPAEPARSGSAYIKLSPRRAMDTAVVGVAAYVRLDSAGKCTICRIAMGAVAPTPVRAFQAEQAVIGAELTREVLAEAGRIAAEEVRPISDIRASADYRRQMVEVITRRVLETAWRRAEGSNK